MSGSAAVWLILNASAGAGHDDAQARALVAMFDALGAQVELVLATDGAQLLAASKAAVAAGARCVVAGGGDGTINAVASVLVDSGVALGVLALGTLNHFARDLGIPLDPEAAVRVALHGVARQIDVGEVNGRIFLNNSSLGLYPDIVRDRLRQQRRLGRGKWLAACWATVAALRRYPFLDVRLTVDGQVHRRRTPFVFIGNNEYTMQGLNIGVRARVDAGKLSVYVAQRPGRLGLLRLAMHALFGTLSHARDFTILLADNMEVATRHRRMRVATDGELVIMNTPLQYRARPGALTVMAPD